MYPLEVIFLMLSSIKVMFLLKTNLLTYGTG